MEENLAKKLEEDLHAYIDKKNKFLLRLLFDNDYDLWHGNSSGTELKVVKRVDDDWEPVADISIIEKKLDGKIYSDLKSLKKVIHSFAHKYNVSLSEALANYIN